MVQMISCIPYGFQIKKKSFKGGKSGCASTTCTWNNDQSILTTILEDDLYEATKLQTEYH